MTWFYFILGCLATFRLALLLTREDGPAWIFRKLRNLPSKKSSAHEGIRCLWCASVWMSAPVTAFFWYRGMIEPIETPLYWLAFSAGAICFNQAFTKESK